MTMSVVNDRIAERAAQLDAERRAKQLAAENERLAPKVAPTVEWLRQGNTLKIGWGLR